MFVELSDSELEIMEVMWRRDNPMSFEELLYYFDTYTDKNWKKQTLNTFLFRMRRKNLLQIAMEGKVKQYIPAMTKAEYKMEESKVFLDKNYQGSIVNMLAAFSGGEKLAKEEIEELKQLLKAWEEE